MPELGTLEILLVVEPAPEPCKGSSLLALIGVAGLASMAVGLLIKDGPEIGVGALVVRTGHDGDEERAVGLLLSSSRAHTEGEAIARGGHNREGRIARDRELAPIGGALD